LGEGSYICGIGGFRRYGEEPIDPEKIEIMLCALQTRGIDATGIALMNPDGALHTLKDDCPAVRFVSSQRYKDFIKENLKPETLSVILHTRAATDSGFGASKGNPRNLENNHPLHKDQAAIVHNGIISNHQSLFFEFKLERSADTDSDIIRAFVDAEGLSNKVTIRRLGRCVGSMAVLALDPREPEHLLMVRSGSPLVLYACKEPIDQLVFASTKEVLSKTMRPWFEKWGVWFQAPRTDGGYLTMRDNTAWLWGPKGLEWHDECKTCSYYNEPNRRTNEDYAERQRRWDEAVRPKANGTANAKIIRIQCEGGHWNKFDNGVSQVDLRRFRCGQKNCLKPLKES
jgi:glucosamine 6-phosphate synthetase-like amidotransferase/phosphosugar isomerase protein